MTRLDEVKEAEPVLRSVLAFVLYLRFDRLGVVDSYAKAQEFVDRLKADLEKSGK